MKYTAVIAAFNIDNIAVHNIDIAVAYLYPDIVPYIMLKHSVKNTFYSFAAEWLRKSDIVNQKVILQGWKTNSCEVAFISVLDGKKDSRLSNICYTSMYSRSGIKEAGAG